MKEFFFVLLLSILISIDGFIIGFVFGLKRIRMSILIVVSISTFSGFVIILSMGIGRLIGAIIPSQTISIFAGVLMIGIGIYNLFHELPLYQRSYFVMIALLMNVDSFGYGIQAGLSNQPFWLAPCVGIFVCLALLLGVIYGHETKSRLIIRYMSVLPALLFIGLGVSKLLF